MNKKFIFGFILGIVLSSSVIYAANIFANNVSYDNTNSGITSNNVQGAIDELYTKANNPSIPANYKELSVITSAVANDIVSGKTAYNSNGEFITGTYEPEYITGTLDGGNNYISQGTTIPNRSVSANISQGKYIVVTNLIYGWVKTESGTNTTSDSDSTVSLSCVSNGCSITNLNTYVSSTFSTSPRPSTSCYSAQWNTNNVFYVVSNSSNVLKAITNETRTETQTSMDLKMQVLKLN